MLSIIILTHNEEKHIRACLDSARAFADELLVFDSGSTDHTVELARAAGARVEARAFDNYPNQRNAAIDAARGDWICFIDADERMTPALGNELREKIARADERFARGEPSPVGFWIPRKNIIFGKWIRHTGWSPDFQPRVLKKGLARFDLTRAVHELLQWDGEVGYLSELLVHYNYETLAQFRDKQERYTRCEAKVWFEEGRRARRRGFVGQPAREFIRRYISLQGWRDGGHGFLLSALMAYYAFRRQQMLAALGRHP